MLIDGQVPNNVSAAIGGVHIVPACDNAGELVRCHVGFDHHLCDSMPVHVSVACYATLEVDAFNGKASRQSADHAGYVLHQYVLKTV